MTVPVDPDLLRRAATKLDQSAMRSDALGWFDDGRALHVLANDLRAAAMGQGVIRFDGGDAA